MKRKELKPEYSPFKYQFMSSYLAANYYKEKYDQTKDPIFLEKYQQYTQQLEAFKKLEQHQALMRLKRKVNRCMLVPMVMAVVFLNSIFTGFFQKEEVQIVQEVKSPEPVKVMQEDMPEIEDALPKGYDEFPLKNESQLSTPVEQIVAKQSLYEGAALNEIAYADLSKIFRNALYQYVRANDGEFPKTLTQLFGKLPNNYLTGIPRDPYYYSNQIKSAYDGTGGWVYDSALGEMVLEETKSFVEAISMALNCNADCGKPSFSPLQITIVKGKHELVVHNENQIFAVYPVALGKSTTQTPEGSFRVKRKLAYPRSDLDQLTNPYGSRVIELSDDAYAIHGTPQEELLGKNVSKGCIRMKNADIIELFSYISIGTPIQIVRNQSEDKKLMSANRAQEEYTTLTPSPMVLSTEMLRSMSPEENPSDNEGDGDGDGNSGNGNGSGQYGSPSPNDSPSKNKPPKNLLPKTPRPDEQSGEISKWKS